VTDHVQPAPPRVDSSPAPGVSTAPMAPRPEGDTTPDAVAFVRERTATRPVAAIVLGSGLGAAIREDELQAEAALPYPELPGFPPAMVPGHAGRLTIGTLFGVPAAVFAGRIHLYEGHGIGPTTLIPRLASALGARALILTNAAGGLDPTMHAGDLMLVTDHVNLMGVNPLIGWRFPDGTPAFVDLTNVYDAALRSAVFAVAENEGVPLVAGVYAGFAGPSYETPAEHAMARGFGASAVGMSTVPEAVAAAAVGLPTIGISCITNVVGEPTSHREVLEAATGTSAKLARLLAGILETLSRDDRQAG
jgi:purine-nucleoside phosphorylase